MPVDVSRRAFVCGGCAVLSGCQVTHVTVPAPSATADSGASPISKPPFGYPCGQTVPDGPERLRLDLADYPALVEVGGAVAVTVAGRPLIVAHALEDCFVAMDRACSHQGVLINYRPERAQFVCPEHGAIYALDGSAVAGPQPSGLTVYPVAREGDAVFVDVS